MKHSLNLFTDLLLIAVTPLGLVSGCGPDEPEPRHPPFVQEVEDACNEACVVEDRCNDRQLYECVPACFAEIEHMAPPRPPCDEARLNLAECQGMLDCDELTALQNGDANPCSTEADDVEAMCE